MSFQPVWMSFQDVFPAACLDVFLYGELQPEVVNSVKRWVVTERLVLAGDGINDAVLERIENLDSVGSLVLSGTSVTVNGLTRILESQGLTYLETGENRQLTAAIIGELVVGKDGFIWADREK